MSSAKLFVKSTKVQAVRYEMPNMSQGGHYCLAAYRAQSTLTGLSPEDNRAKEILTRSGMKFDVVDLSDGTGRRLSAWFGGVRSTPTLVIEGSHHEKCEGINAISDYVSAQKKIGH